MRWNIREMIFNYNINNCNNNNNINNVFIIIYKRIFNNIPNHNIIDF